MLFKLSLVWVIGPPVLAVVFFEMVLNGMAMFNHANIELHPRVDRCLRWIIVTPHMHRIHHSVEAREHRHNFGFNLAIWDHIFKTFLPQASVDTKHMQIGLDAYRLPVHQTLRNLLLMPFKTQREEGRS